MSMTDGQPSGSVMADQGNKKNCSDEQTDFKLKFKLWSVGKTIHVQ